MKLNGYKKKAMKQPRLRQLRKRIHDAKLGADVGYEQQLQYLDPESGQWVDVPIVYEDTSSKAP